MYCKHTYDRHLGDARQRLPGVNLHQRRLSRSPRRLRPSLLLARRRHRCCYRGWRAYGRPHLETGKGFFDQSQVKVLKSSLIQARNSRAEAMFVFSSREEGAVSSVVEGKLGHDQLQQALTAARLASKAIFEFYRETIRKKFSKEA